MPIVVTAVGSAPYTIRRDGEHVSSHTTLHKAIENAARAHRDKPGSEVVVLASFRVRATDIAPAPVDPVDPDPVDPDPVDPDPVDPDPVDPDPDPVDPETEPPMLLRVGPEYFNGQGPTRVPMAPEINLSGTTKFWLDGWVYPENIVGDSDPALITAANDDQPTGNVERWFLGISKAGEVDVRRFSGGQRVRVRAGSVKQRHWQHIAGVYDGENLIAYLDGVEVGRLPATGPIDPTTRDLLIAGRNDGRGFTGWAYNLRQFDRLPAPGELEAAAQRPPNHVAIVWGQDTEFNADGSVKFDHLNQQVRVALVMWKDAVPYGKYEGRWRELRRPFWYAEDLCVLPNGRDAGPFDGELTIEDPELEFGGLADVPVCSDN